MKKRLIMFTAAYPYDYTNAWKGQELVVFREFFDEIYVAPLHQIEVHASSDVPEGVRVLPPVFPLGVGRPSGVHRAASLLSARLPRHLALVEPVPRLASLRRYWAAAAEVEEIMRGASWRDHIAPLLEGSTLYFFWGRGYAGVLPYLPAAERARSLVRLHRWDLYPDINQGYIPFQRRIVDSAGLVAPISREGMDLLARLYPHCAEKIDCLRLGTTLNGLATSSDDGRFRIVSCAYARPVKRLHLIAEALAHVTFPVLWTHIGDGPELPRVRSLCADLPAHVEVKFFGKVTPQEVPHIYAGAAFDLFVNVSESEGIPVSIMEAMAAGIPVVATDAGANGEVVDELTGRLIPVDIDPASLAAVLADLRETPDATRDQLRTASRQRIEQDFDQSRNARNVAHALLSLS